MQLVEVSEKYFDGILDYRSACSSMGMTHIDGSSNLEEYDDVQNWYNRVTLLSNIMTVPEGMVSATQFVFLSDEGKILGMLNARHYLNMDLSQVGGHISFSVRPGLSSSFGTLMLSNALELYKNVGETEVLLTCLDGDNVKKNSIIINGGKYSGNYESDDGQIYDHYLVNLNK